MRRRTVFPLVLVLVPALACALGASAVAQSARPSVLEGLRLYMQGFKPEANEGSLLAYAKREALDWPALQNAFALRLTDEANQFLEWRGHSAGPDSDTFTTLRVGGFLKGGAALLVINREWCATTCQSRTAFAWLEGGILRPVTEASVIPAIRDSDFFPGPVPACLKGVSLGVNYLPSRLHPVVSALAVIPTQAAQRCQGSQTPPENLTRPLRLNWHAASGKFRRGW